MSTKEDALALLDEIRGKADELEALFRTEGAKSGGRGSDGGTKGASGKGAGRAGTAKPSAATGKGARGGTGSKRPSKADVDFDDLKEKFQELMTEKSEKPVRALLKKLGVAKLSELDEDQYADAMAQAQALLDEGDEGDENEGDGNDLFD